MARPKHYSWKLGDDLPAIGKHSLAKHRIISRYIERYIEIVTATPQRENLNITFIDGYAGGGRYRYGREEVPGSPLILLQTVAAMEARLNAGRPKGFKINSEFIFIDKEALHTDFLRSEINNSPFKNELDKSIKVWTADFNERVDDAIEIAKQRSPRSGLAIFLLDQYGWSQVAFSSIRKILNKLDKAEVFLNFSVDSLIDYLSDKSLDLKAFAEIDADPDFVRELLKIKESEQVGYRSFIQNGLYQHVQKYTGAPFYSPFFIKSVDAHRSYWFIHLSRHREARNEIGMIHWAENNTTVHHGGAGLHALGFTPGKSIEQLTMDYVFDEHAQKLSRNALNDQLPKIIYEAIRNDLRPSIENLFGLRCNDTPVVRDMLQEALIFLRNEREIQIFDQEGREKPRATNLIWTDRISMTSQPSFFGPFSKLSKKSDKI